VGISLRTFANSSRIFLIYLKASGLEKKSEEVRVAVLLNIIGEEAVELYNTFNLSESDSKDFEIVLSAFEKYTNPKKNIVIERFKFNSRNQDPLETFDNFVTDLRKLIKSCEYEAQQDKVLRDRIVLGICDKGLQERLLRFPDLCLDKTIEYCRAAETGKKQAEAVQSTNKEVHDLKYNKTVSSKKQFMPKKKTLG
jgi:hypothetical protein